MSKALKLIPKTPFTVQRAKETKTGWQGLSILDADGLAVCNMIARLDDKEVEMARLICAAVNAAYVPEPRDDERR